MVIKTSLVNHKRRAFLATLGTALALPEQLFAKKTSAQFKHNLYASAYKDKRKNYGIAIVNETGRMYVRHALTARGHGLTYAPKSTQLVCFARRPGAFAIALCLRNPTQTVAFHCPADRHFYGHGVFSHDEKYIFATENDFNKAQGVIGVYDATNHFVRVGEFSAYGTGPHDIACVHRGRTLCVANGGIATHPDTGRSKLNLHNMRSSVVFIDSATGSLLHKYEVPKVWQRLSLRHMAVSQTDEVWLGGQYEGAQNTDNVPLVAIAQCGSGLEFLIISKVDGLSLARYIGSICASPNGNKVAVSSPKGSRLLIFDAVRRKIVKRFSIADVCGIAGIADTFITSSLSGIFNGKQSPIYWDNHLCAL